MQTLGKTLFTETDPDAKEYYEALEKYNEERQKEDPEYGKDYEKTIDMIKEMVGRSMQGESLEVTALKRAKRDYADQVLKKNLSSQMH